MRAGARLSVALVVGALAVAGAAEAQTSASFKLTESTMNNGGDPHDGAFALSASFHLRLDAVGDALVAVGPASAGWHMDAGFVDAYRPPGETANLGWPTKTSMTWNPEASAGAYEVYRDLLSTLPGGYGSCFASGLTNEATSEPSTPGPGAPWFYLVTTRNRLQEEGTKGNRSSGAERPNPSPCP